MRGRIAKRTDPLGNATKASSLMAGYPPRMARPLRSCVPDGRSSARNKPSDNKFRFNGGDDFRNFRQS